jgi:hypothetical protein
MRFQIHRGVAPSARRLRTMAAALALATIALTGCSDDPTGPESADPTGIWTLATVGGNRLPASVYEGPWRTGEQTLQVRIDVPGGTLRIESGRYEFRIQLTVTAQGRSAPGTIVDEGTYVLGGGRIRFRSDDADMGAFEGDMGRDGVRVLLDLVGDGHPPLFHFGK